MKTFKTIVALLTVAVLGAATVRARYTSTNSSTIRITGASTLHEWTMEGGTIGGAIDIAPEISANPMNADAWKIATPALVSVTIPVAAIKSEHPRMNRIMLDAMKASQFPQIRYELRSATPASGDAGAFTLKTSGKLTIAGVTRDLQMDVAA